MKLTFKTLSFLIFVSYRNRNGPITENMAVSNSLDPEEFAGMYRIKEAIFETPGGANGYTFSVHILAANR